MVKAFSSYRSEKLVEILTQGIGKYRVFGSEKDLLSCMAAFMVFANKRFDQ